MPPFLLRLLSAAVMAPVALGAVYMGGAWFQTMIAMVILAGIIEWFRMCARQASKMAVTVWFVPGVVYLVAAGASVLWLRQTDDTGLIIVGWLFALVWGTDSGAYLAGTTLAGTALGGPKLAPRISPKKTWAGFIGGIMTAGVIGYLAHIFYDLSDSASRIVVISIGLGIVSQVGDLMESGAKRYFGVKDSGKMIPGHGGVLDRIDGLLAAGLGAGVAGWAFQNHGGVWL